MTDLGLGHRGMKRGNSFIHMCKHMSLPCSSVGKESAYNAGDPGSIPGLGRSPGEEMATHSCILAWRIP